MFSMMMIAGSSGDSSVRPIGPIPAAWDDSDVCFFRCVVGLFPQVFTLGATVLLASYDDCTQANPSRSVKSA